MRPALRVCVALGLLALASPGAAQTAFSDTSAHDAASAPDGERLRTLLGVEADPARPWPELADALVQTLGNAWTEISPTVGAPDSSSIESGLGTAWWSLPDAPLERIRAFVQNGRLESVTLIAATDGPDLAAAARALYDRLGSPRADGFYAIDQTGYPFSLAIDPSGTRFTARAVPGQVEDRER